MSLTTALELTDDELLIIYDALDRLLSSPEPGNLAFLAETNIGGHSFRRRAELTRARVAEHLG
jgi:hypothetical protein